MCREAAAKIQGNIMKLAVLADLHLPDNTEILQWQVLDAALKCCAVEGAELLVLAGDMIQAGAASAAKVLAARIVESALPVIFVLACQKIKRQA
jgi:predicted amidohydrolase